MRRFGVVSAIMVLAVALPGGMATASAAIPAAYSGATSGSSLAVSNGPLVFGHLLTTYVTPSSGSGEVRTFDAHAEQPAVSADGRWLATTGWVRVSPRSSLPRVFVRRLDGGGLRQVTFDRQFPNGLYASEPAWAPGGRRIVFANSDGLWTVNVKTGEVRQVTRSRPRPGYGDREPAWSPDGSLIAFVRTGRLMLVRPDGSRLRALTRPPEGAADSQPDWSPDGSRLVFKTNRSAPKADGGVTNLAYVSRDGSQVELLTHLRWRTWMEQPAWSPDGEEIAVARLKPLEPDHPDDGLVSVAIYGVDGQLHRWVDGPWTDDLDDHYWDGTDWAPQPLQKDPCIAVCRR